MVKKCTVLIKAIVKTKKVVQKCFCTLEKNIKFKITNYEWKNCLVLAKYSMPRCKLLNNMEVFDSFMKINRQIKLYFKVSKFGPKKSGIPLFFTAVGV